MGIDRRKTDGPAREDIRFGGPDGGLIATSSRGSHLRQVERSFCFSDSISLITSL